MDGEAVAEALQQRQRHCQPGDGEDELVQNVWSAAVANRRSETRYKFKDKKLEFFWSGLREAVDPLFEDIVLV